MGYIAYTESDVDLLARLMRAEAEGEGKQGEALVGCVVANRVFCDCMDFKQIRTVQDAVYQSPGGFEAVQYGYFYQRARDSEKEIARRVLEGEWRWPARWALWYFRPTGPCPSEWYNQPFAGQYKLHCFYEPIGSECPKMYTR